MTAKKTEITLSTLDKLVRPVVAEYPQDESTSKPSIKLSLLNDGVYYASIVRYRAKFGEGQYVVCSAKDDSLDGVVRKIAETWLGRRNAKSDLAAALDGGHR